MQNEIDYGGEDASASPRFQFPHQHSQSTMHSTNTSNQPPSGFSAQPTAGSAFRSSHSDQSKNSVFSNALSSPVRRSLQTYHLAQGGGSYYANGGGRSNELNRESNSPSPNDSDMHSDSPPHESYWWFNLWGKSFSVSSELHREPYWWFILWSKSFSVGLELALFLSFSLKRVGNSCSVLGMRSELWGIAKEEP